jgi:perosamine synthetase
MLLRPIHHTFAPLGDRRQQWLAVTRLVRPWTWRTGPEHEMLRASFSAKFDADTFLFASGREALLAILRSLKLTPGEEIIVQGYTCIVVANAITAAGCVPVYVDIDRDTLNLNADDVEKAITPKTRAIMCQHTFGIPADTETLRKLCDKHSLLLIEDCAHILPDDTGPKTIGTHGDILFTSFGRDKAISGVTGGAAMSRDSDVTTGLKREEEKAEHLSLFAIKAYLLYPLLYAIARPLYASQTGKAFLAFVRAIGVLRPIVTKGEKEGRMQPMVHHLPNALAALALDQWQRLKDINDHRRSLTAFYLREGMEKGWFTPDATTGESPLPLGIEPTFPLQKFPFFVIGADRIRAKLKKRNIHLNDGWTNCVICPAGSSMEQAHYTPGSDPEAEAACEKILSLPTHPEMRLKDARKLVEVLDEVITKELGARS